MKMSYFTNRSMNEISPAVHIYVIYFPFKTNKIRAVTHGENISSFLKVLHVYQKTVCLICHNSINGNLKLNPQMLLND